MTSPRAGASPWPPPTRSRSPRGGPSRRRQEIFGDGDFRCAAVAAPIGPAVRSDAGWELTGKVGYASGIPLSTHYMGQALIAGDDGKPTERMLLFVAPRSEFTILDDWGSLMGLKGSASNTITFDRGRIPAHWAIEDALMVDFDVAARGAPGVELHGNPMYGGRAMACFTLTLTAVAIGGAYAALDEYEEMMHSRLTPLPPMVPRIGDETFQRWFGSALAKLATAEAAMYNAVDQHMEACRRAAEDGIPYTYGDDMRIGCIAREAIIQAWEIFQSEIFRTAGSSAAVDGSRFERIYRDLSMLNSHRNTVLREWAFGEIAREHLGLPRRGVGNVQTPRGHEVISATERTAVVPRAGGALRPASDDVQRRLLPVVDLRRARRAARDELLLLDPRAAARAGVAPDRPGLRL